MTAIDLATNTPGTPFAVGSFPVGIAITPDGTTAYVANLVGDSVTPITLATNTPGTAIPVGGREGAGNMLEAVEDALARKDIDRSQIITATGGSGAGDARAFLVGSPDSYAEGRPLTRSQTAAGFVRARGMAQPGDDELSVERYLRGLVTGDWTGAAAEQRAMAEGTGSTGGFMVPTILSAQIIDLARNMTRVIQAGASIVPMPNQTLDIAKWAGDPSSAWHTENAAITPSDATLGKVTLKAKALAALTVVSRELVEDAPNVGQELSHAFAASFAVKVDKAALYGSGTDPEPRGVKNTSGVTLQSMGGVGYLA